VGHELISRKCARVKFKNTESAQRLENVFLDRDPPLELPQ